MATEPTQPPTLSDFAVLSLAAAGVLGLLWLCCGGCGKDPALERQKYFQGEPGKRETHEEWLERKDRRVVEPQNRHWLER